MLAFQVYTSGSYQKLKKKNKDAALFNWAISWTISAISRLLPFPDFSNMESDRQLSFRDGAIIPSDHPNIIFHSIIITTTDKSFHLITPILSHYHHHNIGPSDHPNIIVLSIIITITDKLSHYHHPNDIIITPILSHLITPILSSFLSSSP